MILTLWHHHALAESIVPTKSETDDKSYRGLVLENGLKVMLVSDPDTDQAAASLDVHVGSGTDPDGWNGLAHFLEHMLFLGTGKYPQAGEYQEFIQSRGGGHNAYTSYDHTNYFFSVNHESLEPALDRFSRFFIDPTFDSSYVERERSVVHSEYQARLQEEGRRIWAAQKQMLNPGHPASRFSVGSVETLQDREGASVRDKLVEFYHNWYSANIMALTVVGRQSVDQLEQMVRQKFSEVPNREVSPPLYPQSYLNRDLKPVRQNVVPLKEVNSVSFQFAIPSLVADYRSKPLSYIANLLGHEGEGSLLAALKQRGWADSLSAGTGFMDRHQGTFNVSIGLTEPGVAHLSEIGEMLFHTVGLIAETGLEQWRFEEEQKLAELAFRFAEQRDAGSIARSLSARMHDYPMQDVLSGPYLMEQYDPERIREVLAYITPERVYMQVVSQSLKPRKRSPYYNVRFDLEKVDADRIRLWQQADQQDFADLSLPEPNPFIPERFALLSLGATPDRPQSLDAAQGVDAWYRPDQEFNTPRSRFYFSIKSALANGSPRETVLTELWVRLLNDHLNVKTYPARLAGLEYSLYRHSRGLSARVGGYEDKLDELLAVILEAFTKQDFKEDKLELIKADYIRELKNSLKERPSSQTVREVYRLLMQPLWTEQERLQQVESVDLEAIRNHINALTQELSITALGHGDMTAERTKQMVMRLRQAFPSSALVDSVPRARVRKLKSGSPYIRNLDIDHNDTALAVYFQGRNKSLNERARNQLLGQLLESPFYFDLRTTHRVGYLVFGSAMNILEVPGILLSIQSPTHDAPTITGLIEQFLDNFPEQLAAMPEEQFKQTRDGLVAQILRRDNNLSMRTNRYWQEIDLQQLQFDSREQLAAAIGALNKRDVIDYLEAIVSNNARKLLVQSPGRREQASDKLVGPKGYVNTRSAETFRSSATEFFPAL